MMNYEMMKLELRRIDVCDVSMAITCIICDMETELNDINTTDDRKEILQGSIRKWQKLKDEVKRQFEAQDK